jgi:acyl carrier protein-related protein
MFMDLKEFIEKFAEVIEVEDVESLNGDTDFRDLDEWSSLSVMLLVAFFDEEFEKEIGDSVIKECSTIEDLYKIAIS